MSDVAIVDTDLLLAPCSDASPCGDALDYDVEFLQLEIAARGRSEQQMGDSVAAGEEPDWPAIERLALDLCGRSKDLRVGVLLTRARLRNAGFPGLEQGLRLLAGYVGRYWDMIHPQPEPDEDDTIRINALAALSDTGQLLGDVKRTPLARAAAFGPVSLRDVQIARRRLAPGADTPDIALVDIDATFRAAAPEDLAATGTALAGCVAALDSMAAALTERQTLRDSNALDALAEALREAHAEVSSHITAPVVTAETAADVPLPPPAVSVEITGHSDIVATLDRICRWYSANEPASPVPVLLERAKRLVSQNFLALLMELAPAGADQFRNVAGIRDDEP